MQFKLRIEEGQWIFYFIDLNVYNKNKHRKRQWIFLLCMRKRIYIYILHAIPLKTYREGTTQYKSFYYLICAIISEDEN